MRRFVEMTDGIETDWVDPVIHAQELEDCWIVDTGFSPYIFQKEPNKTFKFQVGETVWTDE